jgi:hypothetical protein
MPNFNLTITTTCPHCLQTREARGDVVRRAARAGKELYCKPCRNKLRFADKPHPTKGTGIKNNPEMIGAYKSYRRAKRRSAQGAEHHAAYAKVCFKFKSFEEFFALLGSRPEGHSIDRIDPLGHYEAGNVRWATVAQQTANRLPKGYWANKQGKMVRM